jgi:hypothetical protein
MSSQCLIRQLGHRSARMFTAVIPPLEPDPAPVPSEPGQVPPQPSPVPMPFPDPPMPVDRRTRRVSAIEGSSVVTGR